MGFMRNYNVWQIDGVASFLHLLESYIPTWEVEDQMRWKLRSNGYFTVRSFFETFWGSFSVSFSWETIWRIKAPCRVSFLCGQRIGRKIITCDNLIKRGVMQW